jgi:plastocyanin
MTVPTPRLLVAACAAAIVSCSNSSTGPVECPANNQCVTLTAANRFSPADLTVDPGTTVRWLNAAAVTHTVTPDDANQPGVWARATTSQRGSVLTHTFTQAGRTYTYHCEPHLADGMTGVIRVR